ncbi:hypothetical protein Hte_009044 [Hypoxylon texense]
MEQPIAPQARALPKQGKMNYACEACRSSKIRCQPGPQPGICKRCSEFKRECVFRSGPRTRRPKGARLDADVPLSPPPGPSKTFSIDFTMPAADEPPDDFEDLRERHERYLEDLVPSGEQETAADDDVVVLSPSAGGPQTFSFNDMSMPTPSLTSASPPTPGSRPVSSLGIQPQFNLDSAARLLASFRAMLPHCPCAALPPEGDVRSMARGAPFVLLAVLAVTSCSASLQNHSLYDDEFRKVLGLKLVAGGERSLELLQGLLIYCSWYPFHLRPKNKQLVQYLRMAVDMVHDLELDEEIDMNLAAESPESKHARLQGIRAYLACFYNCSVHSWAMSRTTSLDYTPWMARCCDVLEACSDLEQDHILVWLVRIQYIQHELWKLNKASSKRYDNAGGGGQDEQHRQLLRIGLETQLRDFQARIPAHLSTAPSIFVASLNVDAYVLAAPLMETHVPRRREGVIGRNGNNSNNNNNGNSSGDSSSVDRLQAATYTTHAVLDYVAGLPRQELARFSGPDMTRLIILVILAYRLSFPVPGRPGYDHARGRAVLGLGALLGRMSSSSSAAGDEEEENGGGGAGSAEKEAGGGGSSARTAGSSAGRKKIDVVTAMRVVLGSVKATFDKKSAKLEAAAAAAAAEEGSRRARMCPMFDGSLDQYLPLWEGQQQQQQQQQPQSDSSFMGSSSYATSSHSHSGSSSNAPMAATGDAAPLLPAAAMDVDGPLLYSQPAAGAAPSKPVFHDLWATMTMGWATDADVQQQIANACMGGADEYDDLVGL